MFKLHFLLFLLLFLALTPAHSQACRLDPSFGDQGIVITDIARSDFMHAMAIQSDQKIVAAGTADGVPGIGGIEDLGLVRYMPDGSLDPEFGNGGIVHIRLSKYFKCHALAIQPDGRIVLAGLTTYESPLTYDPVDDFALVRLNSNGRPDSTFGNGGFVYTDLGGDFEWANEVLIQDDGMIIAVGLSQNRNSIPVGFAMVRYESNGDVDLSFGMDGIVWTTIQQFNNATRGVVQPDGKILLGGYARTGFMSDFAMVRYLKNGSIDSLFGIHGIVQTSFGGDGVLDFATSMLLEPDGKIVLGGNANFSYSPDECDIGVVRYNSDGSLDNSFGNNGMKIIKLGTQSQINDIAQQVDGKYILTGNSNLIDSLQQWLLVRLEYNGEPDTTFGPLGVFLTDIDGDRESALSVSIQHENKIIVGGLNHGGFGYHDFVLARYTTDTVGQTGIQNLNQLFISISPNPCTDYISIDVEDHSGPYQCIISDLSGRIIKYEINYQNDGAKLLIDTRHLHHGFYLLGITNNVKSGVASFVVRN